MVLTCCLASVAELKAVTATGVLCNLVDRLVAVTITSSTPAFGADVAPFGPAVPDDPVSCPKARGPPTTARAIAVDVHKAILPRMMKCLPARQILFHLPLKAIMRQAKRVHNSK
jgi:hypothetical protein